MFGSKKAIDRIFGGLQRRTQRLGAGETEIGANETEKGAMLVSRRAVAAVAAGGIVAASAAARAGSFGNPDDPPQGAINARNPASITDPGPQNPALASQFPGAGSPPATDVGDMPLFWATFNNAPKRIQNGGWARQVTQADFQIATTISGVDMRLTAGAIRELHWHLAAEWGFMTYGNCRVTVLDPAGHAYVADVKEGDLWYFPAGFPHSLQGLGPDGCEFLLAFDDGEQTEYNTLLLTDWMAHTPPDVLALNFGVPASSFEKIPTHQLYIFQSELPGPLAADQAAVKSPLGPPPNPFTFSLGSEPYRGRRRAERFRSRTATTSLFPRRSPPPSSPCIPAACASCIGIRMPTNGSIGSRGGGR